MKLGAILTLTLLALFALAACSGGATPAPLPTATNLSPIDIAATMMVVDIASKATQQALQIQQTATSNVIGMTVTVQVAGTQQAVTQQARQDAIATDQQARRDAQATQARLDFESTQAQAQRDAQATAAQARLDLQATQQAQATGTAYVATAAVLPTRDSLTATAVAQEIVIRNNEVELSNQHVRDQQMTTWVRNFLVPAVIVIAVSVLALAIIRSSRSKIITNEAGDVEAILHDNTRVIRPRLMPGSVIEMNGRETTMPMLVASTEQAEVTKRAQAVEALAVMPAEPARNGMDVYASAFGASRQAPRYEIIEGDVLPPVGLLDDEALKAVEKDWNNGQS